MNKLLDMMLAKMRADNDQDIENGKKWMRESDPAEVLKMWDMLNREYSNTYTEIMTRFAIIGFSVVAEAYAEQDKKDTDDEE